MGRLVSWAKIGSATGMADSRRANARARADVPRYDLRRIDIQGDQLSSDGDRSKESNEEDRLRIVLHGHGLADMKDSVAHQARANERSHEQFVRFKEATERKQHDQPPQMRTCSRRSLHTDDADAILYNPR